MTDPIIQTKTCQHCQSPFDISQGDMDFYDKISPTFQTSLSEGEGSKVRFKIPTPNLCPNCRQRRRLSFRNERKLYKRKCDASGKDIISIYHPDSEFKVFDQKIWWSDDRDPMDYGVEFNFSHSFTENFRRLLNQTPLLSLDSFGNENSDYTNQSAFNKNCYLSFHILKCEGCLYSHQCIDCIGCYDVLKGISCNSCFNSVNIDNCYQCYSVSNSKNCNNCYGSTNLDGCNYCINCNDLANQSYYINNKKVSEGEFSAKSSDYLTNIKLKYSHIDNINCENCDGVDLSHCSNVHQSFDVSYSKNCRYCDHIGKMEGINNLLYDISFFGEDLEIGYEGVSIGSISNRLIFCNSVWRNCTNIYYSMFCFNNSSNLFGCIGLRNKQYCIFNRQYENKEKYEEQVAKIITHMITTGERGEFFHPSLSPFGYNETVAQEYYPLSNDLVIARRDDAAIQGIINQGEMDRHATLAMTIDYGNFGYTRSTYEAPTPQVDKVIRGEDLPVSITDVDDNILKVAIICETSGKPFRIIPQELAFYRKHNIAIPRKHPDVRHLERMKLRRGT